MQADKAARLRHAVLGRLESLQQAGVLQIPRRRVEVRVAEPASVALPDPPVADFGKLSPVEATSPKRDVVDAQMEALMKKKPTTSRGPTTSLFEPAVEVAKAAPADLSLDVIQKEVAACTRCSELASTRTQTVFGVGNPNARLCFLGEAPGADEDRLGEPFVGRGGQLLNKIIEACRLKREDVYILNMLKCRPPGNRNPLPTELSNCRGYLERQLDLIRPEFICCWGAVAAQNLLGTTVSIGKLRGKVHNFRGMKVVCTYHPAFLLRSPSFKKETWEDMKFLFREMGVEL
jgi:uracil-DNA glycosylase family 4